MRAFLNWIFSAPKAAPAVHLVPKPEPDAVLRFLDFLASDKGEKTGEEILGVATMFFPALSAAGLAPKTVQRLAWLSAMALRSGLANGSIVSDGRGGFIPAHGQSKYDPATGFFTGEKT